MLTLDAGVLRDFCRDILVAAGMRDSDACTIAAHLVDAELKNVISHGVNRIPYYLSFFENRSAEPVADITVTRPAPSMVACRRRAADLAFSPWNGRSMS